MEFTDPDLLARLESLPDDALDDLLFGVIGLAPDTIVERYNAFESRLSGLSPARVIGRHFFTEVAPCTNNFMVSHRFEEGESLDESLPYVFTLRMRPRKVELRLLKGPSASRSYILVRERS